MGHAIETFLVALLGAMRNLSDEALPMLWRSWSQIFRVLKLAALPEVLALFAFAVLLVVAVIGIAAGLHLASRWIMRRQSAVFLSFHHSREPEAEAFGKDLADLSVRIERIPFQHSPDHDTLLTSIEGAIQRCDLVACFPGDTPSFVENEVLAATAQNKPLLMIVDPLRAPRLPNTAKKGYPVFDSSLIDGEGKRALAIFCSYLAADMRSTARLYLTAFRHAGACVGAMAFTYIVACVVLSAYVHGSPAVDRLQIDRSLEDQVKWVIDSPAVQAFFIISLFFLLTPYALFTVRRWRIRRRLHRTIAGRAFRDDSLPEEMDVKLSGASLSRLFYRGPLLAHHEDYVSSGPPTVTSISDVKRRELPLSGASQGYLDEESSWLASARITYAASMADLKQPHRIPCPPELCPRRVNPLDTERQWSVWLTSSSGGYLIDQFMLFDYEAAISNEPLIRWPLIFAGYFVWLNVIESEWLWLLVLLMFAWLFVATAIGHWAATFLWKRRVKRGCQYVDLRVRLGQILTAG